MKKIFALLLLLTLALSALVSCGAINKDGEVSVLWSDLEDEYLFNVSDALDRAMYTKNIDYAHYDAEGSASKQIAQVKRVIKRGASALVVNSVDVATAAAILELAKTAEIPLVFLCCGQDLPKEVLESYDKCVAINVDPESLFVKLGESIAADLLDDYDKYDRNDDGKITYAAFGISALAIPTVNEKLAAEGKPALVADPAHMALPTTGIEATVDAIFDGYDGTGKTVNATPVELILTDSDAYIEELLLAMRDYHLNYNKLVTHSLPLYTVGISSNAGWLLDGNWRERAAFSVMNAIDKGYVTAGALEDDDALALACATVLRNFFKGNDTFKGVEESYLSGKSVLIPYTIYGE